MRTMVGPRRPDGNATKTTGADTPAIRNAATLVSWSQVTRSSFGNVFDQPPFRRI